MTTIEKTVQALFWLLGNIIYIISYIVPKEKNLWVFGSWHGIKYSDNSKYLFEYVCKNHSEITAVWLSRDRDVIVMVRSKGYKAVKTYGIKGTWYSLRASVGVISHWTSDLNLFTLSRTKLIQLWHGSPLKKLGLDDFISEQGVPSWKKMIFKLFLFFRKDFSKAMFTAPSPIVQDIFIGAFGVPQKNVRLTGYPRNDVFFMNEVEEFPLKDDLLNLKKNYKIGVYMPTHRQKGKVNIASLLENQMDELNSKLKDINVVLLIKYHFYNMQFSDEIWSNYSNIMIIQDKQINHDIYPVLVLSDFLITDYSSIMFDYLLADKPIIFAPFDIKDYMKNDREFYYSYDEITPGPKIYDWNELADCLNNIYSKPDDYREARVKVRDRFNCFADNQNSKRAVDEIIKFVS